MTEYVPARRGTQGSKNCECTVVGANLAAAGTPVEQVTQPLSVRRDKLAVTVKERAGSELDAEASIGAPAAAAIGNCKRAGPTWANE